MKTAELNTEYLLYDEDCPLCAWYTRVFVKFGFIQGQTRMSYQEAIKEDQLLFDRERAKSEIAFVAKGKDTLYGVDSMINVIGKKWTTLSFICRFFAIYWILQLLYRFISFNRKIIAPTVCGSACSCTPQFNLFLRINSVSVLMIRAPNFNKPADAGNPNGLLHMVLSSFIKSSFRIGFGEPILITPSISSRFNTCSVALQKSSM